MWVMWVYIVWIATRCIRYDKLAKKNVSRISHEKALPAKHSQIPVVTIYHDSSHSNHVLSTCFTSRECYSRATLKNFFGLQLPCVFTLSLTHTIYTHITLSQSLRCIVCDLCELVTEDINYKFLVNSKHSSQSVMKLGVSSTKTITHQLRRFVLIIEVETSS